MTHTPLFPRQPVPDLTVETINYGPWTLSAREPENFTMIVVYRGYHCPICRGYLQALAARIDDFEARGVDVLVVSGDSHERAEKARSDWGLEALNIAYGMTLADARSWGLYISTGKGRTSIGVDEPDLFIEPGLFLIRPDGTLYFGSVQTMPFARPQFGDVLKAIDFVLANDYPARGEVLDRDLPDDEE